MLYMSSENASDCPLERADAAREKKSQYYVNGISVDLTLTMAYYPHAKEKATTLMSRFLRILPFTTL